MVHMAPGFGEDDQNVCNAVGIPTICPMDEHGRYTAEVAAVGRHARVRRQPGGHQGPQGARRRRAPRQLQPQLPALLALRRAAGLPRHQLVVRAGHRVPRPHGRAQPADPLGARAHQGGQLRQVARQRPRLEHQPQPLLGFTDPGVAQRRPRVPAHRRVRQHRAISSATSASTVTDLHRPYVDDLVRPEPRRPHRPVDDAPRARRCSTAGSRAAACRSPRCTIRSRTREWFESHYPGDFIVEYIGQTRGWFYTLHVLATALFDRPSFTHLRQPRHRARRRRPEDVEEPEQLPRPDDGVRHLRQRRHAVVPAQLADPPRHRPDGHRGRHPRHGAPGHPAHLEQLVLPVALRQRGRHAGHVPHRQHRRARSLHPRQDPRPARRRSPRTLDEYDLFAACGAVRSFLDALTNWYVRRSRDRFWAGDQDGDRHAAHRAVAAVPRARAVAAADHRGRLPGAHRRAQRAPHRLARRRRRCRPTASWWSRWTSPATCAAARLRLRKAHQRRVRQPLRVAAGGGAPGPIGSRRSPI